MAAYNVYEYRPEGHPLEYLLKTPYKDIISATFLLLSLLGIVTNALVAAVYISYFKKLRLRNRFWLNLSLGLFCQGLFGCGQFTADYWSFVSDSEFDCSIRIFFSEALDIVLYGNLIMIFIDRLTVVHFPNLYIYNMRNDNCKILYGWMFGVTFFCFKMYIFDQEFVPKRCTSPFSLAFPIETTGSLALAGVLLLWSLMLLGYVFTPVPASDLQIQWAYQEEKETIRALILGVLVLCLSGPKHIITIYYLMGTMDPFYFQVIYTLSIIPTRLTLFLPLLVLMKEKNFNIGFKNMLACKGGDNTNRRNQISADEQKSQLILQTVMANMYPHHPALRANFATLPPDMGTPVTGLPSKGVKTRSSIAFEQEELKKKSMDGSSVDEEDKYSTAV